MAKNKNLTYLANQWKKKSHSKQSQRYTFEPCERFVHGTIETQDTKICEEFVEFKEAYAVFHRKPSRDTYKHMMSELFDLMQASATFAGIAENKFGKFFCCYNDEILEDHHKKDEKRGYHDDGSRIQGQNKARV